LFPKIEHNRHHDDKRNDYNHPGAGFTSYASDFIFDPHITSLKYSAY